VSRTPAKPVTLKAPAGAAASDGPQSLESIRDSLAPDLGALLGDLTAAHESWLAGVLSHRDAVRRADAAAMQEALNAQHACAMRVAAMEDRRRAIVDRASRLPEFAPSSARPRSGPLTLGEIAAITPADARRALVDRADRLRTLIAELRRANSTLHTASAALLAHTEGLMRQVARRLSAAGTYGRRGFVEPASALACAVDLVH